MDCAWERPRLCCLEWEWREKWKRRVAEWKEIVDLLIQFHCKSLLSIYFVAKYTKGRLNHSKLNHNLSSEVALKAQQESDQLSEFSTESLDDILGTFFHYSIVLEKI